MELTINGEKETVEKASLTISELLAYKDVQMPEMVSVEHNGEILDRENFDSTQVKSGDSVEFLYFMGGGSPKIIAVFSQIASGPYFRPLRNS